jgi:hypothetical protein
MVSASGLRPLVGNETLELVLWSIWIACGGVGRTTEPGGYIGQLVCLHALFAAACARAQLRNERESAASASYDHPTFHTSAGSSPRRNHLRVSEGCRLHTEMKTDDTHSAVLPRSRYPRVPPPPACVSSRLKTSPTPTGHAAATRSARHEIMRSRPGALTRPRRLCPTSGETPKPRVSDTPSLRRA